MEELNFKSRIWIEAGDKVLLGPGRVRLLKTIDETGSLSVAAKTVHMSYKKAWDLIDAVNRSAPQPVVTKSTGGKNGGGTILTPYGKELISIYDRANARCWELLSSEDELLAARSGSANNNENG